MNQINQIKEAVAAFAKAGDTNDVQLLEQVLHPNYQNVQDGFFAEPGLYQISKADYKKLVGDKTFGGVPRSIDFQSIDEYGNHMAVVNATLESKELLFHSVIVVVKEKDDWQVLYNLPKIAVK